MKSKFIVAAAAAAIAVGVALAANPSAAEIRPHGGGGHFGGRGGGGAMHFGGGFGHFSPHRFGGGGMAHFASHGFAAYGVGRHGFARFGPGRFAVGRGPAGAFDRTAGLGAAAYGARHGWRDWRRWRRGDVGWGGPVFWPYAYDSVFDYAFWPYEPDDDLFWSYGYDDLFAGVLLPFASAAPGYAYGYGHGAYAPRAASGPAPQAGAPQASGGPTAAAQLCASAQSLGGGAAIDRIANAAHPTPDQNAKLQALKTAEGDAEKTLSGACAPQPPATAVARLDAVEARLQAMVQAANAVSGPLGDFYASLSDEQKAAFNALGDNPSAASANLAATCGPNNAVPTIALDRIDSAVNPDDRQREALQALREAADKADEAILASCPKQSPLTPTGRLDLVKARLQAMLDGVNAVRPPLQDFYASLSEAQKARFDAMTAQPDAPLQNAAGATPPPEPSATPTPQPDGAAKP